ncbi:hypothetical protein AB7M75_002792 [Bradyrhizobium ottawaense]
MVDQDRADMVRPAMNDAMTDRDRRNPELVAQPVAGNRHGGGHIGHSFNRIGAIGQRIAARTAGAQARAAADAVHLSLDLTPERTVAQCRIDLKLDARRAGIDDQDRVHGDHAATDGAFWRRACA